MALRCYPMEKTIVSLKRCIFKIISNRTACYISFKTRNITHLNDIKYFTNILLISKPHYSECHEFYETENVG